MIQYIGGGSTPTGKLQDIVFDAKKNGDYAKEQGDAAKEAATNVSVAVQSANQAAENANAAANNANDKANLADEKASLAQEKIDTLNTLEMNLNQAINDAQTATENANIASTNAGNEAQYAKGQGDYAKSQGDYAKAQGDYAKQQGEAVQGLLDNGPVVSVNGKTGAVTLTAEDVGAATEDQIHTHENKEVLDSLSDVNGQLNYKGQPVGSVVSVNDKTGIVILSASDVGAETPDEAQAKADQAEMNAKAYFDSQKGQPNGIATLGEDGKVPAEQLSSDAATKDELTHLNLNVIDMAVELETLKGATLNGVTANIFIETFQNLDDINLMNGTYDSTNKRLVL